ncbi:tyrosine-type recombinase/integrase (plasmid) [Alicyclobacillus curvatus]|nr:tyrosine-type recombinase/integrase [Alicyclobacillus curvatus]
MSELTIANERSLSLDVTEIHQKAREYAEASKASNTRKAYSNDWTSFATFCESAGVSPMPASSDTVVAYIIYLADVKGRKVSTIQRHLSSISVAHQTANCPTPTQTAQVRMVLSGMKNKYGIAQQAKKAAVIDDIRLMVKQIPDNRLGIRDRALLLIGFAGAFRRSELVALDMGDIELTEDGLTITIRRSKTDQEGKGRKLGVPYGSHRETCPVRAWLAWKETIREYDITEGAAFRSIDRHGNIKERLSDKAVALVVKRYAEAAELNASQYAGHSLRSGFATTAGKKHVSERAIMKQTGHKSTVMVRRYIQDGTLFEDNAAAEVGL